MRKAEIRTHVAQRLAGIGYSHASYAWPGRHAVCHIVSKNGLAYLYAPSGISKRMLDEQIGRLPVLGIARPLAIHHKTDKPQQVDLLDYLQCDGR